MSRGRTRVHDGIAMYARVFMFATVIRNPGDNILVVVFLSKWNLLFTGRDSLFEWSFKLMQLRGLIYATELVCGIPDTIVLLRDQTHEKEFRPSRIATH